MARIPNRQVVAELKGGNPLGCRHLVEMYQERLTGEGVGVFGLRQEDAEEVVSDVLLIVVQKIGTFEFKRSDADFHYWVMTIFRNHLRDFVRHEALTKGLEERFQESEMEGDEKFSGVEAEVVAEIVRRYEDSVRMSEGPAVENEAQGKLRVVTEMLDRLETWERVLLRCRALDVPYEDIAAYTGKPVKQLKVYHGRVKKKFVRMLAEEFPELASSEKLLTHEA